MLLKSNAIFCVETEFLIHHYVKACLPTIETMTLMEQALF
jgi:hypothetical protein